MSSIHHTIHGRINNLLSQWFHKKDIAIYLTPETLEAMYSPSIDAKSIRSYEYAGITGYIWEVDSIWLKL